MPERAKTEKVWSKRHDASTAACEQIAGMQKFEQIVVTVSPTRSLITCHCEAAGKTTIGVRYVQVTNIVATVTAATLFFFVNA